MDRSFVILIASALLTYTDALAEKDWRPNIVVIMADDLGHADLGYSEGNLQTPTPNIDALANDGVILNRYYTNPICTPTRASFMTAKYTFRTGMQTSAIRQGEPWGLPTHLKIAPSYFKESGYFTALLGKWHLGSHTRDYFPTHRGFDYFLGFTHGATHYFNYSIGAKYKNVEQEVQSGRDFFENMKKVPPEVMNNHFMPDILTEKAEQIIKNYTEGNPFYLHVTTPLVRKSDEFNKGVQFSMPKYQLHSAVNLLNDTFIERKQQIASIQALDDQVGRIKRALDAKGISQNTIIAFMSDNGGADLSNPKLEQANHASNEPLRMGKANLFEGGVRCVSFIWSGLFKRRGYVANRLFHVTDWLPTLWEAAGGQEAIMGDQSTIDGVSHWKWFLQGKDKPGPRDHLINNIDSLSNMYAMIREEPDGTLYKMIGGNLETNVPGFRGWHRTEGTSKAKPMKKWVPTSVICKDTSRPNIHEITACIPQQADCLFDLTKDPCEQDNLAKKYPQVLASLQATLRRRNHSSVAAVWTPFDQNSQPALYDNWWVPWLDPDPNLESVSFSPFNPSSSY